MGAYAYCWNCGNGIGPPNLQDASVGLMTCENCDEKTEVYVTKTIIEHLIDLTDEVAELRKKVKECSG